MSESIGEPESSDTSPSGDEAVDEMERESFPAGDAPSSWSGKDSVSGLRGDPTGLDAVPEADDPAVAKAWDHADAMDGQAPTG